MLRGRAASLVALGVTGLVGLVGCSYDRRETLAQVPVTTTTTTTTLAPPGTVAPTPLPCGAACPRFYGGRFTLDPARYTPACYAAHDQFWAHREGNADPASVEQFGAALTTVGASPDVVAAARRWAQVRVDNVARDRAVTARGAAVDLSIDPDYQVMYAAFTASTFVADDAQVVAALNVLCPQLPVMPGTR